MSLDRHHHHHYQPPSPQPPPPPSPACSHLANYRSNAYGLSKPFRSLHTCLRIRPLARADIIRDPHEIPRCAYCPPSPPFPLPAPRLYACLACAVVTCPSHAKSHGSVAIGHEIAVDVDRAELFCCVCGDQVYDPDFDAAVLLAIAQWIPLKKEEEKNVENVVMVRKRRRRRRMTAPVERSGGSSSNSSSGIEESLPKGLRGMNNLGNTCFMSSVLQALMHTPPMRNFFLSDLHNRFVCQQKGRRKKSGGNGNSGLCLACDLDAMYSAVFSGDRTPYSPARFLYR